MKKNDDKFIALSDRKLHEITAKLASVLDIGEFYTFRSTWNVPRHFKDTSEMEEWRRKNIVETGHAKSYYDNLERIANFPQVSITLNDLCYLEDFLLMGEMPAVTIDILHPEKKEFQVNRIWETGDLHFRLSRARKEDKKFNNIAKYYTKLMPEEIRKKHGSVKASKLRKAYSRGKLKATLSKANY